MCARERDRERERERDRQRERDRERQRESQREKVCTHIFVYMKVRSRVYYAHISVW